MTNSSILKKSNEVRQCPKRYQSKGLCLSYFYKEFNSYPSVVNIKHNDYLERIRKFHDPILKYVALYLYHNYVIAKEYFVTGSNHNNDACAVLNRWLDQQKNLYTDFRTCYYNTRWWDINIEPLWNQLKIYYPDNTCERNYPYYYHGASFNEYDLTGMCYKQEVEDYVCYNENIGKQGEQENDSNSIKENCAKLSILFGLCQKHSLFNQDSKNQNTTVDYCKDPYKKIHYTSLLKAEKYCNCDSLIKIIALPIIVTVLGTILLAFFLNEFTPIGSIFGARTKNKVRFHEQFNEGIAYEEYKTYRNNNRNTAREKNIIYYQSMNE